MKPNTEEYKTNCTYIYPLQELGHQKHKDIISLSGVLNRGFYYTCILEPVSDIYLFTMSTTSGGGNTSSRSVVTAVLCCCLNSNIEEISGCACIINSVNAVYDFTQRERDECIIVSTNFISLALVKD